MKERPEICPKCGGKIISIEYGYPSKHRYDGVSEYDCVNSFVNEDGKGATCDYRVGRWSGIELKGKEMEGRFGKGSPLYMSLVLYKNYLTKTRNEDIP